MSRGARASGLPGPTGGMFRRVGLGLLLAGVAGTTMAQEVTPAPVGGRYTVEGQNFEGKAYQGTAEVRFADDVSCAITWVIAGTTSEGVCIRKGDTLSAAVLQGTSLVVAVYDLGADGSLSGFWTVLDTPGVGFEQLTPM
jgi:hypothetical protein